MHTNTILIIKKIKISAYVLGCILLIISFLPDLLTLFETSTTTLQKQISSNYNVNIQQGELHDLYYNSQTSSGCIDENNDVNITFTNTDKTEDTLNGLKNALSMYPDGFVKKLIDTVYIAEDILVEGTLESGGTYGNRCIVLSNTSKLNGTGYNFKANLHAFHHELSSLVYNKSSIWFPWGQLEPKNWAWSVDSEEALTVDHFAKPKYELGFLSAYGATSAENDFNVYAEFAFIEPEKLLQLSKQYPIIAKKLALFIIAYTREDPRFSDYFIENGLNETTKNNAPEPIEMTIHADTSNVKPTISRQIISD